MMRAVLFLATIALPSAITARGTGAQATAPDCGKAARIIEKGHPAKTDYWAFGAVRRCGALGANALASGLARYATETNVGVLTDFVNEVDKWRDASVFDAAARLALNPSATPQARAFAVRHLLRLVQPKAFYTFAGLTKGADTTKTGELIVYTRGCAAQITGGLDEPLVGSPLPPGYEAQIRSILLSLANSATTPGPVRNAARCLEARKA
jgi:hypothetical protein